MIVARILYKEKNIPKYMYPSGCLHWYGRQAFKWTQINGGHCICLAIVNFVVFFQGSGYICLAIVNFAVYLQGSGYMSGMGGVFSLWVGFSMFTVVELLELILDMLICWLKKTKVISSEMV